MKRSACQPDCCSPAGPQDCCAEYGNLRNRRLINEDQARRLAVLFKVLANDTRLRLMHVLIRSDEVSVGHLAESLGMTPQAVSNQLQKLVALAVVESRRDGNSMFYRVIDPCVVSVLDTGLCLMEDSRRRKRNARSVTILA